MYLGAAEGHECTLLHVEHVPTRGVAIDVLTGVGWSGLGCGAMIM